MRRTSEAKRVSYSPTFLSRAVSWLDLSLLKGFIAVNQVQVDFVTVLRYRVASPTGTVSSMYDKVTSCVCAPPNPDMYIMTNGTQNVN